MPELRKPARCPKCSATHIQRILYGHPSQQSFELIAKGDAIPGGCFITPALPDWHCASCKHRWFDPHDPAHAEIEALTRSILAKDSQAPR